jgi:hypothetical protein
VAGVSRIPIQARISPAFALALDASYALWDGGDRTVRAAELFRRV